MEAGASLGGAGYLIPSETISKICLVSAKVLGVSAAVGIARSVLISYFIIEADLKKVVDYSSDATSVAGQMRQIIQERQINIQGDAMAAHMVITANQQRAIDNQQRINATQRGLITDQERASEDQQAQLAEQKANLDAQRAELSDLRRLVQSLLSDKKDGLSSASS